MGRMEGRWEMGDGVKAGQLEFGLEGIILQINVNNQSGYFTTAQVDLYAVDFCSYTIRGYGTNDRRFFLANSSNPSTPSL